MQDNDMIVENNFLFMGRDPSWLARKLRRVMTQEQIGVVCNSLESCLGDQSKEREMIGRVTGFCNESMEKDRARYVSVALDAWWVGRLYAEYEIGSLDLNDRYERFVYGEINRVRTAMNSARERL